MNSLATWPSAAESWLDERGKGAWIAAMVLGFIFFWPVGLALLAYMIWSKRLFSHCSSSQDRPRGAQAPRAFRASGNTAFDAYKARTLERLEREQKEFEAFLERLRAARDQAEFDEFMESRARTAGAGGAQDRRGKDVAEGEG